MKSSFKFLLLILLGFNFIALAQQEFYTISVTDTIQINLENRYNLLNVSIVPFSESIRLRDSLLQPGDYTIQYSTATFSLSPDLPYSILDTLIVTYDAFHLGLRKEYKRRSLVIRYDDKYGDTVRIVQTETGGFSPESIFGSNIQKSGTIVRGFTVGTTKDFTLNSGLRLQLSGRLSDDIEIVAALTDENTPIQPEGNTERLEELDKVFIQIRHPNASGTFGDYQFRRRQGEFGFVDRKLQGLLGEFLYDDNDAYVAVAGSRGKFNSNQFNGTDGNQGPYRLWGINNERDIIIIAGTEKVFLDGIEMRRGENNDYVIDYSNARITFTPNRLITSASRITVDFEYTDRRYARNFFGTGVQSKFFNDKLGIKLQYVREGDDQDAPIDIILSDSDKEILKLAGDDRNKAVKSGVSLAPPDSLGVIRGIYLKVDTLINNEPFSYYIYSPGDSNALYNVSFSFVGEKQGDYIRESSGNYRFVGVGNGGYLPVIYLPMPELKQVANIVVDVKPIDDLTISLEYAGSLWNRNRFSQLDKGDDYGHARNISLRLTPVKISIGELNLGRAGFSARDRFIQDRFTSPDRFNEVEFDRNYNTGVQTARESETLREFGVNIIPLDELSFNSTAGFLRRGDTFESDRFNSTVRFTDNHIYSVVYNHDYVETVNRQLGSKWLRQKGNAFYTLFIFKPGFEFLAENKKDRRENSDSLLAGSLKYHELNPYLEILETEGLSLSGKYSLREDFLPVSGLITKESISHAQFYELRYSGIREVNTTLNLTYRKKAYQQSFKELGFLDNETILVRSQSRFRFFDRVLDGDLFYEVSTQRSARLEKIFVRVEQGTGNYRYLGDLNNNGIADENEFEPTLFDGDFILVTLPTDELFPVIDLKTSTRWKVNLAEIFESSSAAGKILNPFSTETFWRIEENTREENYRKIYFLNFAAFQNEEKTIRGSNYIQQDVFIFENDPELNFRFRYAQRQGMNQFSGGVERAYNRERSLRIRFRLIKELSNQTDLINQTDNVSAPVTSNRRRIVTANNIISDFSYRPDRNIEIGFKIKAGRAEDILPVSPTVIDNNSQAVRFNLSLAGAGRLRIEIERSELIANTTENLIPFELTGGNNIGKNYYWRLNFDYRLSANLQSSVSYDGRWQGIGRVVHTARAEVRAYF